jgi:hypothetical protein
MEPIYVLAAMMAGLLIFSKQMLAEENARPAPPPTLSARRRFVAPVARPLVGRR